ncbi:NADH-quinone oxidoreductase subunit J [Nitrosospira multiformis]|uniref:NADH-quinone oxidoreductase subunit J n=1 Tax=Nitrosospira multiformis (strain ATCC 25196 / NCIMB 11849 / C 71) TaxID=323848 RepID=Q2YA97_NITMU|nr:NADH-quinone oxidoreductase subunit J [Nitrosospira multiformis]ABB74324.1 NADH dehydrogenase subunit J [Nitrosospira multiformis ATCC 25196]SEA08710.1 NADH dehydrogenase subunit J [Nitrosospira multiformis]SEF50298.1 NADH dehydrogenase subunit J [Nitrosospira multiformis ATCC 25196]
MEATFYLSGAVAVAATLMVVTRASAVHALLYLIVSLLAVAIIFFVLGAPFAAALEVIIYAGAVMVLFVFVIMMLNLGKAAAVKEREWLSPGMWVGPSILSALLLAELIYILVQNIQDVQGVYDGTAISTRAVVDSKEIGIALFGPYLLGVELASLLLLAGLVGACHLGWHTGMRSGTHSASRSDGVRS